MVQIKSRRSRISIAWKLFRASAKSWDVAEAPTSSASHDLETQPERIARQLIICVRGGLRYGGEPARPEVSGGARPSPDSRFASREFTTRLKNLSRRTSRSRQQEEKRRGWSRGIRISTRSEIYRPFRRIRRSRAVVRGC